jgi:hypothetical protein
MGLEGDRKYGIHIHEYGNLLDNLERIGDHYNPYEMLHGA